MKLIQRLICAVCLSSAYWVLIVNSLSFSPLYSMSVPHVTGAIAKIWSALPGCTKKQVRQAIIETAKDLGGQGPDNRFGAGLIQVVDAYNYLKNLPAPCGGGDKPAALPSPPGGSLNLEKINKNDRIRGQGGTRQLRGVTEE